MREDLVFAESILQSFERQLTRTSGRVQPAVIRICCSARCAGHYDSFETAGAEEAPGPGEVGVGFLELLEEFFVVEFDAVEMLLLFCGACAADGGETIGRWYYDRGDTPATVLLAWSDAQSEHAFHVGRGRVWISSTFCDMTEVLPA